MATAGFTAAVYYCKTRQTVEVGQVEIYILQSATINKQDLIVNARQSHRALKSFLEANCMDHGPNIAKQVGLYKFTCAIDTAADIDSIDIFLVLLSDNGTNIVQGYYISSDRTGRSSSTNFPTSGSNAAQHAITLDYTEPGWYTFAEDSPNLYINNNEVSQVYFNSNKVEHLYFNNNQIF